jgi:multidrug efflux pump subunit AcrA (membrane-fusion protein)
LIRSLAAQTKRAIGFAVALSAFLSLVGCAEIGGTTPTPAPATSLTPVARPTVVVKRGAISDSVRILGRVAAAREADLYFPKAGKLKSVAVKSGQEVKEGQLVAELDTGDLTNQIGQATTALETAEIKLREAKD